jgi:hypothetical protein
MRTAIIAVVALSATTVLAPRFANATVPNPDTCTVTQVSYSTWTSVAGPNPSTGFRYLTIACSDGNSFTVNVSAAGSAGCPITDADSVKLIASMAQGAKLSGKPLTISWWSLVCPGPFFSPTVNFVNNVAF